MEKQQLEELNEKLEEALELQRQVTSLRKRNFELQEAVEASEPKKPRLSAKAQGKQPLRGPGENASMVNTQPQTGILDMMSPAFSGPSVEAGTSLRHNPSAQAANSGMMKTDSYIAGLDALKYFRVVDGDYSRNGRSRSLQGKITMGTTLNEDIDGLREKITDPLFGKEENNSEAKQPESLIQYSEFLRTGALKNLLCAVDRADEELLTKKDNPEYELRLKDLIVMMIAKYRRTGELEDLDSVIYRATEMIAFDHLDRKPRVRDWITLMIMKWTRTGDENDKEQAILMAEQAGVLISEERSDDKNAVTWNLLYQSGREAIASQDMLTTNEASSSGSYF